MPTQISVDNHPRFAYDLALYRRVGRSSFLTGYSHLFGILLAIVSVVVLGAICPWADAKSFQGSSVFPGKGSKQAWLQANQVFAEGKALSDQGRYREASAKYKSAIALYAFDTDYYQNLGFVYEKDGQLGLAEQAFRNALKLDPRAWDSWNGMKNVLYKQGKYKESKDACIRALQCNPPQAEQASIQRAIGKLDKLLNQSTASVSTGRQP